MVSTRFYQAATRSYLSEPQSFKQYTSVFMTGSNILKTVYNRLSLKYPLSEFTYAVSMILDVFSYFPRQRSSGRPNVAYFSILLASLKDVGRLDRVDYGRTLAYSGLFGSLNHSVASFLPPIRWANSSGPSEAWFWFWVCSSAVLSATLWYANVVSAIF